MSFVQIKAGIIKEFLFFWRGFRFGGAFIAFTASALLFGGSMGGSYNLTMEYHLRLTVASNIGFLTAMILLYGAAGREQKKRSIIIPQTAGLTPAGYVLPKFILYPPLMFALNVFAAFLINFYCRLSSGAALPVGVVAVTGALAGMLTMYYICLFLFFGISTASPAISILLVMVSDALMNSFAEELNIDKYFPHTLNGFILKAVNDHAYGVKPLSGEVSAAAATVAITASLCVVFMLLALFVITARRVDNTADEVY
ncbi:MAG: hypothetical protein LBI38_04595 [Oscillospiraceae bacterium]|jgi:ABC-2 type transport system permease protein|nr:hypothetical protein [Oscillospiraceae bacterium]